MKKDYPFLFQLPLESSTCLVYGKSEDMQRYWLNEVLTPFLSSNNIRGHHFSEKEILSDSNTSLMQASSLFKKEEVWIINNVTDKSLSLLENKPSHHVYIFFAKELRSNSKLLQHMLAKKDEVAIDLQKLDHCFLTLAIKHAFQNYDCPSDVLSFLSKSIHSIQDLTTTLKSIKQIYKKSDLIQIETIQKMVRPSREETLWEIIDGLLFGTPSTIHTVFQKHSTLFQLDSIGTLRALIKKLMDLMARHVPAPSASPFPYPPSQRLALQLSGWSPYKILTALVAIDKLEHHIKQNNSIITPDQIERLLLQLTKI
jgi:hypothetical protein